MDQAEEFFPLNFQKVSLELDKKVCLENLQFELGPSRITAIMGANGSGKTLLLKLCASLLNPTQGKIIWARKPKPSTLTFVPQSSVVLQRSVLDNLRLPLKRNHCKDIEQRIGESLGWAGITHLAEKTATQLSTGRLSISLGSTNFNSSKCCARPARCASAVERSISSRYVDNCSPGCGFFRSCLRSKSGCHANDC